MSDLHLTVDEVAQCQNLPVLPRPALLTLALCLFGCEPKVANLDSPGRTVIAFGDSITAGVGAEENQDYPAVLQQLLAIEVLPRGGSGETSADALSRLDAVLAEQPWLVVVEFGGNDILRRVPIEQTEANLRRLLERLRAARVAAVLVGVRAPYIGGRHADLFERLSREFGAPLIDDALADILAEPALKADQIHPNSKGHRQLAQAVAEVLRPLIEDRRQQGLAVAAAP